MECWAPNRHTGPVFYFNANVITMDAQRPRARSFVVLQDRIVAVGDGETREWGDARRVDLGGLTVVPGFNDAHNHMLNFGLTLGHLDVGYPAVQSIQDVVRLVRERASGTPTGEWILARNYDENKLLEKRPPTRQDLDYAAPRHPVLIAQNSGHMCVLNTLGLQASGITDETPDPEGGRIVHDDEGHLTGLLQERAQRLVEVRSARPRLAEMKRALERAGSHYLSEGITSTQEAGVGAISPHQIRAFMEARREGLLNVRVYMMISTEAFRHIPGQMPDPAHFGLDLGLATGFGDDWLKIGPMKLFADGSLIGRTCAMYEPYANEPDNTGFFAEDPGHLQQKILDAHRSGWQVAVHAIGDRAISTVLDAYEEALTSAPRYGSRHRIEHCGVLNAGLIERIRRLGVVPVPQQPFISQLGDGFRRVLGEERTRLCYPMKSLVRAGIPVPGSSDRPVVMGAPILGIHDAVNQLTASGQPYVPEEAVSPEEALRFYTVGSAYASFEEHLKGSLTPGRLADFVVLDRDPTRVDKSEIKDTRVLCTVVGGKARYAAAGHEALLL
ncbi:MAG: amidohydrolase [Bacillota bacterium]|nr:amidohydrolase [Bacillota bacterium]